MTDREIRIAWYDRTTSKYDYGAWKEFKFLKTMNAWINDQNKKIPQTKYWVEYRNDEKMQNARNIEEVECIKIESDSAEYTDYLMIE
jgi:uncharacterized FlgJ-related protein